jgi:DNA-binding phage protein
MSQRRTSIVADLREAIRQAEQRGMTRGRIAMIAGIPRSQMTRVASGENTPRLDTAEKIARALGLSMRLE